MSPAVPLLRRYLFTLFFFSSSSYTTTFSLVLSPEALPPFAKKRTGDNYRVADLA